MPYRQRTQTFRIKVEPGRPVQLLPLDVQLFELLQAAQIFQPRYFVVAQVELFEIFQPFEVFDLAQIVPLQVEVR